MFGIIIIAIIVYAVIQHRKRNRLRWMKWGGDEWQKWAGDECASKTSQAERYAHDFETKMSRRFDASAEKFEHKMRQRFDKQTRKYGGVSADPAEDHTQPQFKTDAERQAYNRARRRAAAEAGFYVHLMWYGVVIGFLFIINLVTGGFGSYPWFLWPALGWGFGVASHFSAVYGWRWVHDRVFEPAIQREVQREVTKEKEHLRTEKQASLDELTATFAHEIRNPIAAAKSLVQQMGEDPTSHENVEYAKVALDELARVERSVSHLLKYAKEEDYNFENVNLSSVLDGALTQMRSKLEANSIVVSRAYLSGPTVRADADKLRQVFSNIIDNAIDAMESTTGERRLEFAIQNNGEGMAAVRIRDNGCGIADDKLAKIYNPFYTSKSNGTGLGLGVAKKVIDAHRGMIQVQSKVGTGTEFILAIPLSDAMRQAADADGDNDSENDQPPENGYAPAQPPSPIMTAPIASPAAETSRLRN
ncbi:MAG: ATP-binding protein [Candidatus Binatus sp.]|uniref:ATP-binding protein n=1 Tax=Candidatus Binatus sp. TaxID=2811406 RepID=UPI00271B2F01|nr:ATP-binding protein [Candidatus Binatus sp.]MDO8430988.1 ATP-binding protein [Candidatus Binatus sp.]